jgi:tryptophan-rich sensory protein
MGVRARFSISSNCGQREDRRPMTAISTSGRSAGRRVLALAVVLGAVLAVSAAGSLVTLPKIPTWYAGLQKPFFTPPSWLFGPVWSALYLAMAVAAWRIWDLPATRTGRTRALIVFAIQLALNAIWSPAFFGLQSPLLGIAVILALLATLIGMLPAFWRLDRVAGSLLLPYLLWVAFATALNGAIVALN